MADILEKSFDIVWEISEFTPGQTVNSWFTFEYNTGLKKNL